MRRPVEGPYSHDDRQFVRPRYNDRLERGEAGRAFQLIDGILEEGPGVRIADEEPLVRDLDIVVENGVGCGTVQNLGV